MRLFGRKANQVSTKRPDVLDVPPELRPYYREQAVAAQARYTALRVFTVVLIAAVLLGGTALIWTHRHTIGNRINNTIISTSTNSPKKTATNPAPKQNQGQNKSTSSNNQSTNTQNSKSAQNSGSGQAPNSPSSNNQSNPPQSTSTPQPAPAPQPTSTTAKNSAGIPNTGPGDEAVIGAVIVGSVAASAHYVQKRRAARLHQ